MENNQNSLHDQENQGGKKGQEINFTKDNKDLKDGNKQPKPDGMLPEDDPAVINPDELASFPKEVENEDPDIDSERDSHAVNLKSSPVRDGRNITNTGPNPNQDGFL